MAKKNPMYGKVWKNESRHNTFESADLRRGEILKEENPNLQVKVRRMSASDTTRGDFFVVKIRATKPADPPKKNKTSDDKKREKPKTRAGRRSEKMKRKQQQAS